QSELTSHLAKAFEGGVSEFDRALFKGQDETNETKSGTRDLLAVLEVCQNILQEAQDTKELVATVGNIAIELRDKNERQERVEKERSDKELGMMFVSQLFQNPENAEKLFPLIEKFAAFGDAQQKKSQDNSLLQPDKRARKGKP